MAQHQKIEIDISLIQIPKSRILEMGKLDIEKTPFIFQKIQHETTRDNFRQADFDFHICTWTGDLIF
jgi:hypothetical protein